MKTKIIIPILILLSSISTCFAEETETPTTESKTTLQWRINYICPGVELEIPIQKRTSLVANANIDYSFSKKKEYSIHSFYPIMGVQYRFYYNLDDTPNNTKNCGAFFTLKCAYEALYEHYKTSSTSDDLFYVSPSWGFQWVKRHTFINFEIGPGIYYTDNDWAISLAFVSAKIGWAF